MKTRLLFAAFCLAATPALAQDKPFDMYGLNTTDAYAAEMMVAGKKCKLKGVGEEECVRAYGAMIGNTPIMGLYTRFNDSHLISIRGTTPGIAFSMLDDAFTAKYGPATKTTTPVWQNKMGATFENVVKVWTFSDGVLEIRLMGDQRDISEFIFVANKNLPARAAQPQNF